MAQSYSLTVYAITVRKRGDKEDRQVLSDFNNGQDFLVYMDEMLSSWKQNQERGDQYVPVNTDTNEGAGQGNAYRLSRKTDNTYHLYRRGRYLSGILESGDYGTQEEGVDITTGEVKFQKRASEALMRPFYFKFYIPENSNTGFLLLEKIGNYGIKTIIESAILNYFKTTPCNGSYTLKIDPLSINALVQQKMHALRYEAKKVELRKVTKNDLDISRVSGNTISNEGITTTVTYNVGVNKRMHITDFLDWIKTKRNPENTLYVIEEDMSCGEVAVTVDIDGQSKVLSLQDIKSLGMSMDISNNIQLGSNGYPTFEFIDDKADELISFVKQQFDIQ